MGVLRLCLTAALAMSGGSAAAIEMADGLYGCTLSSYFLGDILIEGGTFRGPAFDGEFGEAYPFEVTDGNTINWGGPLGGLSTDGNQIVSTVLRNAGGGKIGFDITIQNARGNFQMVSCAPN